MSGVLRGRGMDEWTPKQVADTVLIDRRARRCAHKNLHSCCSSVLGLQGLVPAACSGILEGRAAPCFLAVALCFTQPTVFSSSRRLQVFARHSDVHVLSARLQIPR